MNSDDVKRKLRARIYKFQQDLIEGDVADLSPIIKHTFNILESKSTYDVFCLTVHMNEHAHNGFRNDVERSILLVIMEQGDHEGTPLVSVDAYVPKHESTDETADYDMSEQAIKDPQRHGLKSIQHLDESQTGMPIELDTTVKWMTRMRTDLRESDGADDKRTLYRLQQELIDAGFEEVSVIKTPAASIAKAAEEDPTAPTMQPYSFMCDGHFLMYYYTFARAGQQPQLFLYDLVTDKTYESADQAYSDL